jgi:post-segregation antitoxin (ccd killing protein)
VKHETRDLQKVYKADSVGSVSVSIPDELEQQLREKGVERFGLKRGYLSKAVEEAIRLWLKENQ